MLARSNIFLTAWLGMLWYLTGAYGQAPAAQPDYGSVNDILNGRRTLLRVDDIVFGAAVVETQPGITITPSKQYVLPGAFDPNDPTTFPGFEILTRMFDAPVDTLIYPVRATLNVRNPATNANFSLAVDASDGEFRAASIAAGDLTGDGFSEVVIASDHGVRVITAVDPHDFSKGIKSGNVWTYPGPPINAGRATGVAIGDFDGDGNREVAVAYYTLVPSESIVLACSESIGRVWS